MIEHPRIHLGDFNQGPYLELTLAETLDEFDLKFDRIYRDSIAAHERLLKSMLADWPYLSVPMAYFSLRNEFIGLGFEVPEGTPAHIVLVAADYL
jgi:hypothetical protein